MKPNGYDGYNNRELLKLLAKTFSAQNVFPNMQNMQSNQVYSIINRSFPNFCY